MALEIKQLEKSEVEITGEMPAEEFAKFWPKAIADLSKDASMPGFRPGKIPEKVLVEKVGESSVLQKAAEIALQSIYGDILKEKKIEAIGYPKADITKIAKGEALGYKFVTAVLPEITLPENYKNIAEKVANKKEEVKVEDKEVNDSIEHLRKTRAKQVEGKEPELPELNDEFAKSIGKFETIDELKETIKKNLQAEKEYKLKEKKRLEMLDAVIKETKIEIPDILLQSEKGKMLNELKGNIVNMGMKWEDYLAQIKKKEEELLEALRRVNYGLILRHFGKILDIKIEDSEIEDEIKKFNVPEGAKVDKERMKDYAYGVIRNEKIFKLLENNKENKK